MEKKLLRKNIGKEKQFDAKSYGRTHTNINEVIEFFTKAKKSGATHIDWYAGSDYNGDSESCQAQPFYEFEETEEESERRIKNEAESVKRLLVEKQRRERAEYERLKEKFNIKTEATMGLSPTEELHITKDVIFIPKPLTTFKNVEWAFQFNDDEPKHLAEPNSVGGVKELTFTIRDTNDSYIVFTDDKGNQFKIFAREKR